MNWCKKSLALLVLVNGTWLFVSVTAGSELDAEVSRVLNAWKQRQSYVQSAEVSWTARVTDFKGGLRIQRGSDGGLEYIPPQDSSNEISATMAIEGGKTWYRCQGKIWSSERRIYVKRDYTSAFSGKESKRLTVYGNQIYPQGMTDTLPRHPDATYASVKPIALAWRPLATSHGGFEESKVRFASRGQLEGRDCLIFEGEQAGSKAVTRLWVEPRSFTVLQYTTTLKDKPVVIIEIEYEDALVPVPRPRKWRIQSFFRGDGALCQLEEATVTDVKINPKFPSTRFHLEFPPGTKVTDIPSKRQYLIRKSGPPRPVLRSETLAGVTYDELMNTEPGDAIGGRPGKLFWWALSMCAILALVGWRWRHFFFRARGD